MLRIKKLYEYLTEGGAVAIEQTSYPGIFVSIDDFYSVHREKNNWFIMETTNSIYDDKLYTSFVNKHLYWQRVLAALLLGNTTKSMIDNISKDSSGTYNNQWMIFDNEAWKRENKTGSLTVMEEMRGLVKVHDVTNYLLSGKTKLFICLFLLEILFSLYSFITFLLTSFLVSLSNTLIIVILLNKPFLPIHIAAP